MTTADRLLLAVEAYTALGQSSSIRQIATLFDVPNTTLRRRLKGAPTRAQKASNERLLNEAEEQVIEQWVLDMDARGYPLRKESIHYMASKLLTDRIGRDKTVGQCWVTRYIQRHPNLHTTRYRAYDAVRRRCEDPQLICEWVELVKNVINKYNIEPENIYNMDETGFAMGRLSSAHVVTAVDRAKEPTHIQTGDREWVTAVETISAGGRALDPLIILQGKRIQQHWFENVPATWHLTSSANGWTNDQIARFWLDKVFLPQSLPAKTGAKRLLILDGHGSHTAAEFDALLKDNNVFPLYMPPHSSHLLQALDVGVFSSLKQAYRKALEPVFRREVPIIDKAQFLKIYVQSRPQAFTQANILSAFKKSGSWPCDASVVLEKIARPRTPVEKPANEPTNQSSPYEPATPHTTRQLNKSMKALNEVLPMQANRTAKQCIEQIKKGAEMALNGAKILIQENNELRTTIQELTAKNKRKRRYMPAEGAYNSAEAEQLFDDSKHRRKQAKKAPNTEDSAIQAQYDNLQWISVEY